MPRSAIGLLAALGAVLSALVGLTHGDLTPIVILCSGTATGVAAWLALPPPKKIRCSYLPIFTRDR
jgi:hypothetical protein